MLSPVSWATWPILGAWLTSLLAPIPTVQSGVNSRVKWQMQSGAEGEPSEVERRISCDHVSAAQASIGMPANANMDWEKSSVNLELHQTPRGTTQQFQYCCCTLEV